jgi:hypothetical protein
MSKMSKLNPIGHDTSLIVNHETFLCGLPVTAAVNPFFVLSIRTRAEMPLLRQSILFEADFSPTDRLHWKIRQCSTSTGQYYEYFMYSFFSSIGNRIFEMAKCLSVRLNDVMKVVAVFIRFLKSF